MARNQIKRGVISFLTACQLGWLLHCPDNQYDARELIVDANDEARQLRPRSIADNLIVYNALGKRHNLALVEHSRRTIFKPGEWDCIAFMHVSVKKIPDNNPHLRVLIDELECTIPRTPGTRWGDFLQFITPVFVSNYDYIALVLDDMFIPDRGPHAVDANKILENMQKHDVQTMTPGIVGDTYNTVRLARKRELHKCIAEVEFIETYVQFFTRDAWECYYKMLHYTGGRGWCYDVCFKSQCPEFRLGQDFSMTAWHMGRGIRNLPKNEVNGTALVHWAPQPTIFKDKGFFKSDSMAICNRLKCDTPFVEKKIAKISCPADRIESISDTN